MFTIHFYSFEKTLHPQRQRPAAALSYELDSYTYLDFVQVEEVLTHPHLAGPAFILRSIS